MRVRHPLAKIFALVLAFSISMARKFLNPWVKVLVVLTVIGMANITPVHADESSAKSLFKAMSDYLAAQNALSFDYDSTLEIITRQNQKIGLASSGTLILERPDKLRVTDTGGFSNIELVFDGTTMTMLGKYANIYTQEEMPGTIDRLLEGLRDKYHRPAPAADLLMSGVYDHLMPLVVDAKDLGTGVIGRVECNHLAFRTEALDWQIWIARGSQPRPCRYVISSVNIPGAPQYTIDLRGWKTGAAATAAAKFSLAIPEDATKLQATDVPAVDELPRIMFDAKRR